MQAAIPPNLGPRSKAILQKTKPNGHFALMTDGTLTLICDGKVLDSAHAVQIDTIKNELSNGSPIVVYGIGAGQLVTAVRSLSEEARGGLAAPVLVYEPDPGILASFLRLGLPMQGVSIACDLEDFRAMFQNLLQGRGTVSAFHNSFTIQHSGSIVFDEWIATVKRIVDAEQVTTNTITVRLLEWVANVSRNIEVIHGTTPLMAMAGEFTNVPAFIVGAGPSLDKNGHLLKECASKGLVFTVDVAGRAMHKFGAEPHIFVAVEGQDLSAHLDGIEWIDRVPRAFSLEASPAVLLTGKGPLLPWCDSNHAFTEINTNLLGVEGLPIGGSVTTAAMLMAESFGCNPIILVGQDLANTGRKRAAGNVLADKLSKLEDHGSVQKWGCEEYYHNPRSNAYYWDELTDSPQWLHARIWFEQRAALISDYNPQIQLLNCTEGGSHVRGFSDMRLADLLVQMPDVRLDVMGKFGSVQPIWREGVDWFRKNQVESLAKIVVSANVVADACESVANMLETSEDSEVMAVHVKEMERLEYEFRVLASKPMFLGCVQNQLRALHDLREPTTRMQLSGSATVDFFRKEVILFREMGLIASKLLNLWEL